jgi:hypothetical protein
LDINESSYLGDGAYIEFNGYGVILYTTYGGNEHTNEVFLEPAALREMYTFLRAAHLLEDTKNDV